MWRKRKQLVESIADWFKEQLHSAPLTKRKERSVQSEKHRKLVLDWEAVQLGGQRFHKLFVSGWLDEILHACELGQGDSWEEHDNIGKREAGNKDPEPQANSAAKRKDTERVDPSRYK